MSPTALLVSVSGTIRAMTAPDDRPRGRGVYPGYGTGWVLGGYYTGYYPGTLQDPNLVIFSLKVPTHGQMRAILMLFMRFLRMGLEWVLEWVQNGSQNDLQEDPPDWSPDCPQIPISRTSDIQWSRIGLIQFY